MPGAARSTTPPPKAGPPPPFLLDTCPSFQEQQGTKPVFFDRHATFKRLRDESLSRVVEEATATATAAAGAAATPERCPYLPDWTIAHSGVWALAEAGLIRAIEAAEAAEAADAASPAGRAAGAAAAAPAPPAAAAVPHPDAATTIEHLTQLLPRPAPVNTAIPEEREEEEAAMVAAAGGAAGAVAGVSSPATGRSQHATPFATHHLNLELQPSSSPVAAPPATPPPASAAAPAAPARPEVRQPSVTTSQSFTLGRSPAGGASADANGDASPGANAVGSSLRSWLSRARSLGAAHGSGAAGSGSGAAAWPVPLGLGAALTPFQSLRGSMRRSHGHFQLSEGGGGAAAASGSPSVGASGGGHAGAAGSAAGLRRGHTHHVAFAAGLAAATSTAVAVSSAGGVAVSGFVGVATAATTAAAASVAALSTASAAVQLGGHAIEAGSDMLLNRVQGKAMKRASAAVADAVLGPAASAGLRHGLLQRLRATVAGASVAWFVMNHMALSDGLVHLDFEHDFVHSAKLMLDLATSGPQAVAAEAATAMAAGEAVAGELAVAAAAVAVAAGGAAASAAGGLLAEAGGSGGGAALQEALQGALHNMESLAARDGSFGRLT
ncbi:hypothetical protein HXX76_013278 [Chlamydomonas incerta]|uniref:Uncharacterized protein n=1 Tax=Chlamydomonas incerta TaxID=51695 RepID=A0A835SST0_CHLIN|nr:hypothetical protein HXX76_013278 [Chlamydomonas incerta]|eukprot:KAG2426090.1 hypothetical protein HXX76_013278 [Chlamydomonas incerta]